MLLSNFIILQKRIMKTVSLHETVVFLTSLDSSMFKQAAHTTCSKEVWEINFGNIPRNVDKVKKKKMKKKEDKASIIKGWFWFWFYLQDLRVYNNSHEMPKI